MMTRSNDLPFKTGDSIRLYGHTNVPPNELTPWATGNRRSYGFYEVLCQYPLPTTPWFEFLVTVNDDGTISLQGHTDQEPNERSYVATSRDDLSGPSGTGNYGIYCKNPEPDPPWTNFHVNVNADGTLTLRGHTDRNGTESSYLVTTLQGIEGGADIPISYNVRAREAAPKPPWTNFRWELLPSAGERLHDIINAPDSTPYPSFSGYREKVYWELTDLLRKKGDIPSDGSIRDAYQDPTKYPLSFINTAVETAKIPSGANSAEKKDWNAVVEQIHIETLYLTDLMAFQTNARISANNISEQFSSRFEIAQNILSKKKPSGAFLLLEAFANMLVFAGPALTPLRVMSGLFLKIAGSISGSGSVSGDLLTIETQLDKYITEITTQAGDVYGPIAKDWGKLQQFHALILEEANREVSKESLKQAGNIYERHIYQAVLPSIMASVNNPSTQWGPCGYGNSGLAYTPSFYFGQKGTNPALCKRLKTIGVEMEYVINRTGGWSNLSAWGCGEEGCFQQK